MYVIGFCDNIIDYFTGAGFEFFLNSYFPARRNIAFGIAVYYNKFVFSIVLVYLVDGW